jgi:hypothetical protein
VWPKNVAKLLFVPVFANVSGRRLNHLTIISTAWIIAVVHSGGNLWLETLQDLRGQFHVY